MKRGWMTRAMFASWLCLSLSNCVSGGGGNDGGTTDSQSTGDATVQDSRVSETGSGRDGAAATDSGSSDRCATEDPLSTLGCNGGFSSAMPAANSTGGTCTAPDMNMPRGTCTSTTDLCFINDPATTGVCVPACTPSATNYVSTGGCATGSRCFDLGNNDAFCFRDCDATHPCPTGQTCDGEGSCSVPGM